MTPVSKFFSIKVQTTLQLLLTLVGKLVNVERKFLEKFSYCKFDWVTRWFIKLKLMLALLKTLTDSKDCSDSASNFCHGFLCLSLVNFLQCTMYIHNRLSEQF